MEANMEIGKLVSAIHFAGVVDGLTHNFYRYPARFSPIFARTAIELFTKPGETILDPFAGSGTSLVESLALGRHAVGVDISELAVFLAQVKTLLIGERGLQRVQEWASRASVDISPCKAAGTSPVQTYPVNLPWRFRKVAEQAVGMAVEELPPKLQAVARCIVLKAVQWALDCKKSLPTAAEFRKRLDADAVTVIAGLRQLRKRVRLRPKTACGTVELFKCAADEIVNLDCDALKRRRPRLVITSPPYPGIHVLYHRWQVLGRRETPAPFWIAACNDGEGSAYYTFGDRRRSDRDDHYFRQLEAAFTGVRSVVSDDCVVAQLVGFCNPVEQLPRYLDAMRAAGFAEFDRRQPRYHPDQERFWRAVPNRKWYNWLSGNESQTKEILLLHRAA
jgi:hypothetical protein